MTDMMRVTVCPICHREPSVVRMYSRKGYAVTCEFCGGLFALGDTEDAAKICWNRAVDQGDYPGCTATGS